MTRLRAPREQIPSVKGGLARTSGLSLLRRFPKEGP